MAVSSSCGVVKSLSSAATISSASVPKATSMRCPQSVASIRGACEPQSSPAVVVDDKDFQEKLLEQINNLQQLVSKSLGDATGFVSTKAEEAMSSLKFGNDKAAENPTEIKNPIGEAVEKDKLAQN